VNPSMPSQAIKKKEKEVEDWEGSLKNRTTYYWLERSTGEGDPPAKDVPFLPGNSCFDLSTFEGEKKKGKEKKEKKKPFAQRKRK